MVMPGDDIAVTVELISPVAMEDGIRDHKSSRGLEMCIRDRFNAGARRLGAETTWQEFLKPEFQTCLLYTSDAADD